MSGPVYMRSYAKINWTLEVLSRREDGYHEIRTIYQTISLYDRLRIQETESSIEITCNDPRVPCDETNLVHKAARLLREATGASAGAAIEIKKRIPVAAGLGGGSSNAAVALVGLCRAWRLSLAESDLNALARAIGSDVPFFLVGGTALGLGRGEEIRPLDDFTWDHILLVNPGVLVSTKDVYANLSRLTSSRPARMIPFGFAAAKAIIERPLPGRNDLEESAVSSHPEIATVKDTLSNLGAKYALMSGSGATVYGVFDNLKTSERALSKIRATGLWSERVRTVGRREYKDRIFELSGLWS